MVQPHRSISYALKQPPLLGPLKAKAVSHIPSLAVTLSRVVGLGDEIVAALPIDEGLGVEEAVSQMGQSQVLQPDVPYLPFVHPH